MAIWGIYKNVPNTRKMSDSVFYYICKYGILLSKQFSWYDSRSKRNQKNCLAKYESCDFTHYLNSTCSNQWYLFCYRFKIIHTRIILWKMPVHCIIIKLMDISRRYWQTNIVHCLFVRTLLLMLIVGLLSWMERLLIPEAICGVSMSPGVTDALLIPLGGPTVEIKNIISQYFLSFMRFLRRSRGGSVYGIKLEN